MRSKQTLEIYPTKEEARDRFGDSEEREAHTPPKNKPSMFIRIEAWPEFPLRELRMSGTFCRPRRWTEKTGKPAQLLRLHRGGKEGERRPFWIKVIVGTHDGSTLHAVAKNVDFVLRAVEKRFCIRKTRNECARGVKAVGGDPVSYVHEVDIRVPPI